MKNYGPVLIYYKPFVKRVAAPHYHLGGQIKLHKIIKGTQQKIILPKIADINYSLHKFFKSIYTKINIY